MEQKFPGISFRNFGCTSRGWPKIPFHLTISVPFDHSSLGLDSPSLEIEFSRANPQANISALPEKRLKYLTSTLLQWIASTNFSE